MQDIDSSKGPTETLIWDENDPDRPIVASRNPEDKSFTPFNIINKYFSAGSMKGSIFTLVCATLGTGLLLIPNAMSESGVIFTIIQMVLCAALGYYTLTILIHCAHKYGVYSYQSLAEATFGKWCKQLVNVIFFLMCWGASITILLLISQLLAKAIGNFDQNHTLPGWMTDPFSKLWPIIIATVFVFPLSLARELKQLRYICFLSFCFMIILATVIIYYSFTLANFSTNFSMTTFFIPGGVAGTFSTTMFAFACHPNALDIFKELQRSNERRMNKVIYRTLIITVITYMLIGFFGYVTFCANLNVLNNTKFANGVILFAYGYDADGNPRTYPIMAFVSLILNGFSLIILEPLVVKPAKDSLDNMLFQNNSKSKLRHFFLVTFTVYSAVGVCITLKSIPKLVNVLGSSLLSIICFIFPASFYLKLYEKEPMRGNKLGCVALIVGGTIFGIYATIMSSISLIQAEQEF